MLLAMTYYALIGRHWFKGPRINVEHLRHVDTPGVNAGEGSDEGVSSMRKG